MPKTRIHTPLAMIAAVFLASCSPTTTPTPANLAVPETPSASGSPVHADCASCHTSHAGDPRALKNDVSPDELCTGCHADRIARGEHSVGIKLKKSLTTLPLVDGKSACISCHDPHGSTGLQHLLRLSPPELCRACHDK